MISIAELKRAVVVNPSDAQARYALAEAMFAEADYAGAVKQLEKALELAPDDGNIRRLLAHSYEKQGRPENAQAALETYVRLKPHDVSARDELIGFLLGAGRVDDAVLQCEEAIRLDATDVKRRLLLGQLFRRRRLNARAKVVLEEAQRLAPNDPHIAGELKDLYLELGDEGASGRMAGAKDLEYFTKQIAGDYRIPAVRQRFDAAGWSAQVELLIKGELSELRQKLSGAPETALSCALRGEIGLLEGRLMDAEREFGTAISIDPQFGLVWNRLGDIAQSRHALDEAVGAYKKAILFGAEGNAWEDLADVYATQGKRDQAKSAYEKAIKAGSSSAKAKLESLDRPAEVIDAKPAVGRIGVLGWNPVGGAVSPLEALAVEGKGELMFSANVGPSGREAASVAHTVLKAYRVELGLGETTKSHDLHMHFTDSEVGKDGPSGGLALLLAGASAYSKRALKAGLAASGELTLHGAVKPVGGIHEKLVAAHLAGLKTVIVSRQNLRDTRQLPEEVKKSVEIIFVDTIFDAIRYAFHVEPT